MGLPRRQWILVVPILAGLLMAAMNLYESYKIGILNRTAGYPFGGEGPIPYYYKTAESYALVNAVFGFVFLVLSALCAWSFIRFRRRVGLAAFVLIVFAVVVMYFNGKTEP